METDKVPGCTCHFVEGRTKIKKRKMWSRATGGYGYWKHAHSYELDPLESIHRIKMTNARTMQRRIREASASVPKLNRDG